MDQYPPRYPDENQDGHGIKLGQAAETVSETEAAALKEALLHREATPGRPSPGLVKPTFEKRKLLYSLLLIFGLVVLNLYLIYPIFTGSSPSALDSGEIHFINLSQFILDHFPHHGWDPLWYAGFPFNNSLSPLVPYLLALVKAVLGFLSLVTISRVLGGFFYLLAPVSLYLLVRYLTKKEFTALVAALLYSMPPFLIFFLPSIQRHLIDYGNLPWQSVILSRFGDLPHLVVLALLPLYLLSFIETLRHPSYRAYLKTAILLVVIALASWYGLLALTLIGIGVLFSEIVLGNISNKFRTASTIFFIALGLGAFIFTTSYYQSSFTYGDTAGLLRSLVRLVPLAFALLPIIGTALFLAFDRKSKLQPYLIGITWVLILLAIALWGQLGTAPEKTLAERFVLELWMGVSLLFSLLLTSLLNVLRHLLQKRVASSQVNHFITACVFIIFGFLIALVLLSLEKTQNASRPLPDVNKTAEYRVGQWLSQQASDQVRVFASDNLVSWLDVFTNVPQVGGGYGWGVASPVWQAATDEITGGTEAHVTAAWLEIFNAQYVVTSSRVNRVAMFNITAPEKFQDTTYFKPVYTVSPYQVYEMPLANAGLAQVVASATFQGLGSIVSPSSTESLDQYLEYLDALKDRSVDFEWENNETIKIKAELGSGEGLAVQIPYDSGWRAEVAGQPVAIRRDPYGFMYLEPERSGVTTMVLRYGRDWPVYLGYASTIVTILILLVVRTRRVRKTLENFKDSRLPKGVLLAPTRQDSFVDMMMDEVPPAAHEETKNYYREKEDLDWVEATDNFQGLETYFYRNREMIIRKLIDRFGMRGKYLDAGCGTGLLLRHLPPGSIGLDINPRNIAKARKHAPEAALVVADIDQIPFPDNMFSTIVCSEVLEHVPDPRQALREMYRVLKPGGVVIGTVPRRNPMWRLRFLSTTYPTGEPFHVEFARDQVEQLLGPFEKVFISPALSYMTWAFVVRKRG